MGAGFDFRDETFWGTNGAIEAYLEALAHQAAKFWGADDPLAEFFRNEREGYFTGKVVFLDDVLTAPDTCGRFVRLLDAATEQLMEENTFSERGRAWVENTVSKLRQRVSEAALA